MKCCALFILTFFLYCPKAPALESSDCAFCNPERIEQGMFDEDTQARALVTHKPIYEGHVLIIPRAHRERFEDLSEEEITQMGAMIKRINLAAKQVFEADAYFLLQKNGTAVGQSVPHVHFHYIPCKKGKKISAFQFFWKNAIAQLKGPISSFQMSQMVKKMKEAMGSLEETKSIQIAEPEMTPSSSNSFLNLN